MRTVPAPGPARAAVLARLADAVLAVESSGVRRVAVDGVDGAGKSVFADELSGELTARGRTVIRASVDGFHQPRSVRYRRGRSSPEGYFRDSFDYAALRRCLLDPLGPGGDGRYRTATFDWRTDSAVQAPVLEAAAGDVLVLDGIFLHRDELLGAWDLSVWLDVPFAVSHARMAGRDGSSPDPDDQANRRYVEGQRLYLAGCRPARRASFVVDNSDLGAPVLRP